ncbi:hypothetical protein [Flavobacterium aquicola]|uniref:Uncharacterized protein n=1 Tax=Flavobacterium aquicola TaxID=1682742 RepID=A0A3E0E3Y0_9FLAO|nr:hypothetical protein [Flavobacterium aquicola]REG93004.1 hypothetical protein C8P67_114105 [Flavobacterium aquicola]
MNEFKKVPIYIDEEKINSFTQPQASRIEYFRELVTMYQALNTGEPLQKDDLTALIRNPKEFIAKRLIKEETLSLGGLELNFEKMFDIIQKPLGTEELINKIINDSKVHQLAINQRNAPYFEIKDETTVVLNSNFLEQTTEQCTVYLKTENEVKAYEVLSILAENVNKLNDLKTNGHWHDNILFEKFFETNNATGSVAVNPYFGNLIR